MTYMSFLNLPSAAFVLSALVIAFVATGKARQSLALSRDMALPFGVCGTLVGMVLMLTQMADPSALGPAISVALLCTGYGIMLYGVLTALSQRFPPQQTSSHAAATKSWPRVAVALWITLVAGITMLYGNLAIMLSLESFVIVVIGSVLLARLTGQKDQLQLVALGKYSLLSGLIALVFSIIGLFASWDDLTSIGPLFAVGLLGMLYSGMIFVICNILHHTSYGGSLPYTRQGSILFTLTALSYAMATNFMIMDTMVEGDQKYELMVLNKNKSQQDDLLRKLAIASSLKGGNLTVSTDTDAWIFIDDMLVGQAPLYQHKLPAGEHQLKITSCDNPNVLIYSKTPDITWQQYWPGASDGECEQTTPEKMKEYVKAGKAKEIVISSDGETQQLQYELLPGVNLCCDTHRVKELTVNVANHNQVYAWSFASQKWMVHPQDSLKAQPNPSPAPIKTESAPTK